MLKKVTATLFFDREDEAEDFYHDCQNVLPKSITINPGLPNEEKGHIELEECHHDESPTIPCILIESESSS